MPPGRKEWFHDPSDDYVIGPPGYDKGTHNKTDEEFWKEYNKPKHLTDYVPGTRILKSDWTGMKFWEQRKIVKQSSEKAKFPTSEGKCPLCGNDLHLIPPFGIYSEFYGCNSFPNCDFKCSVKQYQCAVKEVPNGEPIGITNTMKASEAKALTVKNEKWKYIRKSIDKEIKNNAERGESSMKIFLYEEHDHNKVIESLKNDGFKANCICNFDPRENDITYVYKVSW